jgi:hypothetical protein
MRSSHIAEPETARASTVGETAAILPAAETQGGGTALFMQTKNARKVSNTSQAMRSTRLCWQARKEIDWSFASTQSDPRHSFVTPQLCTQDSRMALRRPATQWTISMPEGKYEITFDHNGITGRRRLCINGAEILLRVRFSQPTQPDLIVR